MEVGAVSVQPEWRHLPRLEPRFYRGYAVVFWTLTLQPRATGWLDDLFHSRFREWLAHAGVREGLICPVYVLMPDHAHLVWMGIRTDSDQRGGIRFLRKYVQREFDRRAANGRVFRLQKQAHDHVLRDQDRTRGAFARACGYVLDNPRRAGLVEDPRSWAFRGSMVLGYPFLDPWEDEFWLLFWRFYGEARRSGTTTG